MERKVQLAFRVPEELLTEIDRFVATAFAHHDVDVTRSDAVRILLWKGLEKYREEKKTGKAIRVRR